MRQDHPAVGLAAPACCDMTTFKGESTYIHVLRILARLLNGKFQAMVERVVAPYGGKHKSCNIKGDQRMRNKANSADDHRYEAKPRPALNIDIVRCCATFGTVAALRDGVAALVAAVSRGELGGTSGSGSGSGSGAAGGDRVAAGGGVGRVKNGFAVAEAVAAKSFHYRSFMLNLVVNFGSTLGELCATPEAARVFDAYVNDWKERNPGVPWGTWRAEAQAAVDALRTSMAQVRAVMVCEVQCLLAPYLAARKEMHLLYKVVRAASDKHLAQQFLVAKEEEGRAEGATWASEERRAVEEARGRVEERGEAALFWACTGGFVKAVEVAMQAAGVDVNWADPDDGETALYQACAYGHLDVVRVLLAADGIQANQAIKNGSTPLYEACSKGHLDVVRELLGADGIQANQAQNDGQTPLSTSCQNGHVDVVRLLLTVPGIDVEKGATGWPPLKLAKHFKHGAVVSVLESFSS